MKKFISWVVVTVVLTSMVSCREIEELSTTSDEMQNNLIHAKIQKDSIEIQSNDTELNESFDGLEGDPPPKKDEIKW